VAFSFLNSPVTGFLNKAMLHSFSIRKFTAMKDLWYKNAIVYSLDVETFMDSDGDGVCDFQGLTPLLPRVTEER